MLKKSNISIFVFLGVCFSLYLIYLNNTAYNIIYMDQVRIVNEIIRKYYEGILDVNTMFKSSAGHRALFYHIISIINAKFFSLNTLVEIYAAAVVLLLIALVILKVIDKDPNLTAGKKKIISLCSIFILFSLNKWEFILIGLGFEMMMLLFIEILMLYFLADSLYSKKAHIGKTILLSFLAIFFFSQSYFLVFLLSVFITIVIFLVFNLTAQKKLLRYYLYTYLLIFLMLIIFNYFSEIYFGLFSQSNQSKEINFVMIFNGYLNGLAGAVFGNETFTRLKISTDCIKFLGICILLFFILLFILLLKNKNKYKTESIFFTVLMVYGSMFILTIAYARSGEFTTMSSRYGLSLMFSIIASVYFSFNFINSKRTSLLACYPIIVIILFSITNYDEVRMSKFRKAYYINLEKQAIEGSSYKYFQSDEEMTKDAFQVLKKYHLNIFK